MKKVYLILLISFSMSSLMVAQTLERFRSIIPKEDTYQAELWEDVTAWQRETVERIGGVVTSTWNASASVPNPAGVTHDVHIGYSAEGENLAYGEVYVKREGDLNFEQGVSLYVHSACTLVVIGNLTFLGNNSSITVADGGVLIVSGNLTTDLNNLDVGNDGKVAIGGDLITGTGNTGTIDTSDGDLYVIGETDTQSTTGTIGDADDLLADEAFADFVNIVAPNILPVDILPVDILYFKASAQTATVELNWAASKAWDFSHYELERSRNGQSFEYVTAIDAEENTDYLTEFTYTDRQPLSGISYYRLKAVDVDGKFEYKGIEVVQFMGKSFEIYPNPVTSGKLKVSALQATEGARLLLRDHTGRTVRSLQMSGREEGISTEGLPAGVYLLLIQTAAETVQSQVLIH